jgi:hypothetical protein
MDSPRFAVVAGDNRSFVTPPVLLRIDPLLLRGLSDVLGWCCAFPGEPVFFEAFAPIK